MTLMENEGHPNSTLIRTDESNIETVVFVGNGAIENGWMPLRETLDHWLERDQTVQPVVTNLRRRNQEVFHQLAILSYKFKIKRGLCFAGWSKYKRGDSSQECIQQTFKSGLTQPIKTFLLLRKEIAASYQKPSKTLSLRIDNEIDSWINSAHFITTNWDNTLWIESKYKNLIHLHGRCEYPDSMVFPTELLVEDAAYDFSAVFTEEDLTSFKKTQFAMDVVSTFRSSYLESLFTAHSLATKWLGKAKRIVIWGYSLGNYDADINALIGTYAPDNKSGVELIIIDPNFRSAERAVALTGITNAISYNPITKLKVKVVP